MQELHLEIPTWHTVGAQGLFRDSWGISRSKLNSWKYCYDCLHKVVEGSWVTTHPFQMPDDTNNTVKTGTSCKKKKKNPSANKEKVPTKCQKLVREGKIYCSSAGLLIQMVLVNQQNSGANSKEERLGARGISLTFPGYCRGCVERAAGKRWRRALMNNQLDLEFRTEPEKGSEVQDDLRGSFRKSQ